MYEAGREAIRVLRRRPTFCGAVVAIMALSIGSCTAIFTIVTTVLLARLPYADPGRLAIIWHSQGNAAGVVALSPGDYATYRDTSRSFNSVAAISTRGYNVGGAGEPARVTCGRATPDLFPMLGVNPRRGRSFTTDEDRSATRVVVLSDRLWRSQFGSDERLIGRSILLDAVPHTVIGIMPPSFSFPPAGIPGTSEAACWVPTSFTPADMATPGFDFVVVAKIKSGVSLDQARDDVAAGARRIWESYPAAVQSQVQLRARLVPLAEQLVASSQTPLLMFSGSVLLLLAIGCANVSNLMLTRPQIRRREMVVRAALGATRAALAKQLLAEAVLLAVAGSVAGVLLAQGFVSIAVGLGAGTFPRLEHARVDGWSLGFALACAVLAGVLGGVAPVLRSRAETASAAAGDERTLAAGLRRDRLRSTLIVLEIGMAVVVLTAAALLARTVVNLNRVAAGFNPAGVLTFSVALPPGRYQRAEAIDTFSRAIVERLRQIPTVSHAAVGSGLPIGRTDVAVVSLADAGPGTPPYRPAAIQSVTPDYGAAFGIGLIQGRSFNATDTLSGQPVAVVNETMARTYWSGGNVIGKTMVRLGDARPLTIVGIMADVRQAGLIRPPVPTFYVALAQAVQPVRTLAFVARTSADPVRLAPEVRRILSEADATLPLFALQTGENLVAGSIAPQRFNMFVVVVFAAIALSLAVTGLYAVLAYMVAQSSREFGVRIALGATTSSIVGLVAGRAMLLLAAGVLFGAAVSAGLSQFVASQLFGVQPNDPSTIGLVALLLLVVSSPAIVIPAVRAARVDPLVCLRHE